MTFCTSCGKKLNAGATKCDACGAGVVSVKTPVDTPNAGYLSSSDEVDTRISHSAENQEEFATRAGDAKSSGVIGAQMGRVLGGRYQLDECIGSGGMGEIYRARRLHIGDTVAVKVLRPDVVENDKSRQRFYREARAAAMLHHPNAVVIHDFGEDDDGTTYIVMELLLGRNLRQLLVDHGTVSPWRAYSIIRQACAALDAGHRNGIVHRDIKPDNIVLLESNDGTDIVKILDFGIAKLRDKAIDTHSLEQRLTNMGTIIGTPHYMSPEQCQGEEADARSDIYSLGVVLYELLTGVAPFVAKTPTGIAIKHVTEKPRSLRELNPNISASVDKVVLRALEKDPNARQQTTLDLARELEAAVADEPDTARLQRTGEPSFTGKSGSALEEGTELLPGKKTGEGEQVPPGPPQSYETRVTPAAMTENPDLSGTELLGSPETSERSPITDALRPGGEAATEYIGHPEKTSRLSAQAGSLTTKIGDSKTDKLRTNFSPPAGDLGLEAPPVAAPEPVKTKHPRITKPSVATGGKSRAPLYGGIGAALLVLVLAGWWLSSRSSSTEDVSETTPSASPTSEAVAGASPLPTSAFPEAAAPEGMVYVLGGVFRVGRDDGDENSRPAHVATVKPYFMDRTEVTNAQYQKFIDATGYQAPPSWQGNHFPDGTDSMPVVDVTWEDAAAYAAWAGKRLPTEEEWEFAARGPDERIYPWGNDWVDGAANLMVDGEQNQKKIAPVGQYLAGASPFGILDLSGNVWEWTASDYAAYPGGKIEVTQKGYTNLKVIRGGSFESPPKFATATLRRGWPATRKDWPNTRLADYTRTGFRCIQDVK